MNNVSSLIPRPLPDFISAFSHPQLHNKIWEWPENEATMLPQHALASYLSLHRWVLGMSPAGSCDLLSALRLIFETITEEESESTITDTLTC